MTRTGQRDDERDDGLILDEDDGPAVLVNAAEVDAAEVDAAEVDAGDWIEGERIESSGFSNHGGVEL